MSNAAADAGRIARRIRDLLDRPARREAGFLLVLIAAGTALETLGIGLILPAIVLLGGGDEAHRYPWFEAALQAFGIQRGPGLVAWGVGVLAAVHAVRAAFLAWLARRQSHFVYAVQSQLSLRLFRTYLEQPWLFHLQRNSAHLIRNVVNEVNLFALHGLQAMLTLISESLVLACILALLLVVEPLGTLAFGALLAVAGWGFHRLTRTTTARAGAARQHHEGLRLQHLQQGLAAVREIQLMDRASEFAERCRVHTEEGANAGRWLATLVQLPRLWLELLAVLGLAVLAAILLALGRAEAAMLPLLAIFAAAAFRLMPSVQRLMNAAQALHYARPAIDLLHTELSLGAPQPQTRSGVPLPPLRQRVEVRGVSFRYPGAPQPTLQDASLVLHRGEWVAIVGASGAGKSTLVHILLGLLAPDEGCVRVDGTDIRDALRGWHDQVAFVPQSVCVIDDTVAGNVAFGVPAERIDHEALWRVLRAVKLAELVRELPEGLATRLGERGVRLSGGQIQRIGLARALYRDPAVLVLDEPTGALDTATESEVLHSVRAHGTRTVLVVAHRASTVAHCDRCYTLERGRVVEAQPSSV
jgi:ABC-type multidrug transport system fused ATPase/permease subunit